MRNVQNKRGRLARILLRLFIVCLVVSLTSIIVLITNGDVTDTPEYKATHSGSDGLLYSLTKDKSSYVVVGYEGSLGKNVTIPSAYNGKKITGIGSYAFYYCAGLTSVTIPNSVTSIGAWAFAGCSSLTSIDYQGAKAQWNAISKDSSWDYNTGNYTIYCTNGNIAKS